MEDIRRATERAMRVEPGEWQEDEPKDEQLLPWTREQLANASYARLATWNGLR